MTLVTERLAGCTAESLDSYLRGLGFFLLAGEVEPSVHAWWDEDGVLWLGCTSTLDDLVDRVVSNVRDAPPSLRMPWRGEGGRELDFISVRNQAHDSELDWFDACALARPADVAESRARARERSDRENNPLLGQGGSFGRSDPEAAYRDALAAISSDKVAMTDLATALIAALRGNPPGTRLARLLSTTRSVLGAYQSGRATAPGSSIRDVEPTRQPTRSSVWDVILVFTGLRLFRGGLTRRPDSRARAQASFPFLARSRPIGTAPGGLHELRVDDPQAFEFLAPLWSSPCSPRTLWRLLPAARLRLRYGIAQDTLDAVLVQAGRAAHGLGFDRLVRFALVAGADPRYRFAVHRGTVHARGLRAAQLALDEILPFLRELDRAVREVPPSLAVARRQVDDALAAFGRRRRLPDALNASDSEAMQTQEVLIALAALQTAAARAVPDRERLFEPPRLSSRWFRHADDGSPVFRLARSFVAGLSDDQACLLRETLLPQRHDSGRFVLDAARTPPDLDRVSDPLAVLVELALAALRRNPRQRLACDGSTRLFDLTLLLSGALGGESERRFALLCAALAGVHPTKPRAPSPEDPLALGIGTDVARLLLAAQPGRSPTGTGSPATADETATDALGRMTTLASLLLAGRVDLARTAADRELRRRGLDPLPLPPQVTPPLRPARLALAVLLPFGDRERALLERVVTVTPIATPEGGPP